MGQMAEIEDLDDEAEGADGVARSMAAVVEALAEEANLARRTGDFDSAYETFLGVLDIAPDHTAARLAAAELSRRLGRPRESLQLCLGLLEGNPRHVEARREMAEALRAMGLSDEAHAIHALLLHERPDDPESWCALATLLAEEEMLPAAEACLGRTLILDPAHIPAWAALARYQAWRGNHRAAVDSFHMLIVLEPDTPGHHAGLAASLMALGRLDEARAQVERALALDDEIPGSRLARADLHALAGRLGEEITDAHWRWYLPESYRPPLPGTAWDGGDTQGEGLLLYAEAEPADAIRNFRFIPLLVERGIEVTVMVPADMVALAAGMTGVTHAIGEGTPIPLGLSIGWHAPLFDLPLLLGLDLDQVPALPYLEARPRRRRPVVTPPGTLLRIGLAWKGRDAVPLSLLLDLADIPDVVLFALEAGSTEAADLADPALVTDFGPTIADMADLAGRLAELDVIVAADGATAQLAAAMGKPVLLLLASPAAPLWGTERDGSPWYPSMRFFRQETPGNWRQPLSWLRKALADLAADHAWAAEEEWEEAREPANIQAALLTAHLAGGDVVIDIGAGDGSLTLDAVAHEANDIRVLALEADPAAALALAEAVSLAGAQTEVEIIEAAAGSGDRVLVTATPRLGRHVFRVPDWLPVRGASIPVSILLAERPQLDRRRILLRLGQPGWEKDILDDLSGRLDDGTIQAVVLDHRPEAESTQALVLLAARGFSLWKLAHDIALGPAIPFLEEEAGCVLALAPGLEPAAHYGRSRLPASPDDIKAAREEAARLADEGLAHQGANCLSEAAAAYGQAMMRDPFCPGANANKGVLMHMAGRREAAAASYRRALARHPTPAISANLGNALRELERFDEAEAAFAQSLAGAPDNPDFLYGLALLRRDRGNLADAASLLRRVLTLRPNTPYVNWALAQVLVAANDPAGFALFGNRRIAPPPLPQVPVWHGEDLAAASILVHTDSDFADSVMLARLIPLIGGHGGLVTVACPPELAGLMEDLAGVERVVCGSEPIPVCDLRVALSDLPRLLNIAWPPDLPPLQLPGGIRPRRVPRDGRLRVGITWGGRPTGKGCPLESYLALAVDPNVVLVAVADEDTSAIIESVGARSLVESVHPPPADLAEAAGVIAGLDLVIGGDTPELHLAAALGKPAWLLLPNAFTWRWPQGRDDSPWYPSAQIFRQSADGDWATALGRIAAALKVLAARKRRDAWL